MELRYSNHIPEIEIRNADDNSSSRKVTGYAVVFDSPSTGVAGFTEVIARHALDGVIQKSDVLALLDHNQSRGVLARCNKGQGSLSLEIDERGLKYSFIVPNTALGDELIESIRRGDITGSSFSFTTDTDSWEQRSDGSYLRTVNKISRLYDVSPVYQPAYEDSSVEIAKRSLEEFLKTKNSNQEIPVMDKELEKNIEQENNVENVETRSSSETEKKEENVEKKSADNSSEETEEKDENNSVENKEEEKEENSSENEKKNDETDEDKEKENRSSNDESKSEKRNNNKSENKFTAVNLNMTKKENFSLRQTINDLVSKRSMTDIASEINEAGLKEARNAGVGISGQFHIPSTMLESRAAGVYAEQGDTSGGYNTQTDKLGVLEPLYANLIFNKLGCTTMYGLSSKVSIPTYSGTTANWASELGNAENGAGDWGEVTLEPHRLTSIVEVSLEFLALDNNNVESMLKRDIVGSIQRKLEATAFGDAAGSATQPEGLLYNVTADSAAITWDDIVLMQSELSHANFNASEGAFVANPAVTAVLKTTKKDAGSGRFVLENNNIDGLNVFETTNVVNKGLILGVWSEFIVASFSGISLSIDDISKIDKGVIRLIVNSFWDLKTRRPEAFVKKILA